MAALPMVMLLADRLTSTSAPASAARVEGGIGAQRSSQISTWKVRSRRAGRNGTADRPKRRLRICRRHPAIAHSGAGAKCRRS